MLELGELLGNSGYPALVTVSESINGNARSKIDVLVAILVPDGGALTVGQDEIEAAVGVGYVLFIDGLNIAHTLILP